MNILANNKLNERKGFADSLIPHEVNPENLIIDKKKLCIWKIFQSLILVAFSDLSIDLALVRHFVH